MADEIAIGPEGPTPPDLEPRGEEGSAGSPEASVETLRAALHAKTREAAEAQDRYLRTLADFDNYRRRTTREREEWRRQAQIEVVREILPVLDNFDRALAAEVGPNGEPGLRAGVELIHRDFLKALDRIGIRPFSSAGELFDPARHEAVARIERGDLPDQTVVEEILRGYLFHERVLRPAQVVVAVEPTPPPDPGEAPS